MNRPTACLIILLLAAACDDATPVEIDPVAEPVRLPEPVPPAPPPMNKPGRIYEAVDSPYYAIHGSPLGSRYVLYDDGTFSLQYSSAQYPFFQYTGSYVVRDSTVAFTFNSWSTAGEWGASARITEDSLTVEYNLIMVLSDFEGGLFLRKR